MTTVSIGDELKDGFKRTDKWIKGNIQWLGEMESFYRERAAIERDYAEKLKALTTESFRKKAKMSSVLSVGEEPVMTPGSLECASMVAWNDILSQAEAIAKERAGLAKFFDGNVAGALGAMQGRYDGIRQRWEGADNELREIRDAKYADVSKTKKLYDEACAAMETRRSKAESGRGQEKLAKREGEMGVAKNNYLITINVANRLKDKYYYQDVPELLDGLQALNEAKVSKVNTIWLSAAIAERQCNGKIDGYLNLEDEVVKQNLPQLDSAMYVKHNVKQWSEPKDFVFEPSPIWHDESTMVVTGAPLEDLKLKLNNASAAYEKYETICTNEKQSLEEIVQQREKLVGETLRTVKVMPLKDYKEFETLLTRTIGVMQEFANDDTRRVSAEVEIEAIQSATDGKDMTYIARSAPEKKSRFGFLHKHGSGGGSGGGGGAADAPAANGDSDDVRSLTSSIGKVSIGNTKSRLFGHFRKASSGVPAGVPTATVNYPYDASDTDELSTTAGEVLTLVEGDDGSGWVRVKNSAGQQGLVPASYVTIDTSSAAAPASTSASPASPKKQGPKVAPRRGAKKVKYVQALYDYAAQGSDELSISAGDKIVVVSGDNGGWTEGELNGQKGLFPTSYAQAI